MKCYCNRCRQKKRRKKELRSQVYPMSHKYTHTLTHTHTGANMIVFTVQLARERRKKKKKDAVPLPRALTDQLQCATHTPPLFHAALTVFCSFVCFMFSAEKL
jgi:hypothetical protein